MNSRFHLLPPSGGGPAVLWGGEQPSGSLKYLTYAEYLRSAPRGVKGLVEISGASTALALDLLGRERGLPTVALTDAGGAEYLRANGFQGEVRTVSGLGEARDLALAYERKGWCWPRQHFNRELVSHVEAWAHALLEEVRIRLPGVRHLVCGFGTGATLAGLHRVFGPAGYTVEGLESAPGQHLPGWRNYAQMNMGAEDIFLKFRDGLVLHTAHEATTSCLAALLAHVRTRPHPELTLVISHNGRPEAGAHPAVDPAVAAHGCMPRELREPARAV